MILELISRPNIASQHEKESMKACGKLGKKRVLSTKTCNLNSLPTVANPGC